MQAASARAGRLSRSIVVNHDSKRRAQPRGGYGGIASVGRGIVTNEIDDPIIFILFEQVGRSHDALTHAYALLGENLDTHLQAPLAAIMRFEPKLRQSTF